MRLPIHGWRNAAVSGGLLTVLWLNQGTPLQGQERGAAALPPGDGRELVATVCTQCHALRAILIKRDGRPGWRNVVERMVLHGGQLTSEEADAVVEYVYQQFGPSLRPLTGERLPADSANVGGGGTQPGAPVSLPPGAGKELVEARCTICHDLGRVVGLTRSRQEWEQITQDMISRGGTEANAEQIQVIASYLAAQFGKESR